MRIHKLLGWSDAREALHVAIMWRDIARTQEQEKKQIALEGAKALAEIAQAWRISLEAPEIDLRDEVDALLQDLEDKIALMQEHF